MPGPGPFRLILYWKHIAASGSSPKELALSWIKFSRVRELCGQYGWKSQGNELFRSAEYKNSDRFGSGACLAAAADGDPGRAKIGNLLNGIVTALWGGYVPRGMGA